MAIDAARGNTAVAPTGCATMGDKLKVRAGADVVVAMVVRDPDGTNYAPYSFPNPSLAQVGISQPLNRPVLDHVDFIGGMVTGYKQPTDADYAGAWPDNWIEDPSMARVPAAAKNTSAAVLGTFTDATWQEVEGDSEYKVMVMRLPAVTASQYIRARGTNLPPAVPFETDADGNPLPDVYTNARNSSDLRIPCTTVGTNVPSNGDTVTLDADPIDGCPNHLPQVDGVKYVAYDVAAWADSWFYSNPIFVEVAGSTLVAGVK